MLTLGNFPVTNRPVTCRDVRFLWTLEPPPADMPAIWKLCVMVLEH